MAPNFFDLISDIRQCIYEIHFQSTKVVVRPSTIVIESTRARKMKTLPLAYANSSKAPPIHSDCVIFLVNKQMHSEAEAAFYRTALFIIDVFARRPSVQTELLYRMRRISGGAEVRQLFELDVFREWKGRKHSLIGSFDPDKMSVREWRLSEWMSSPMLAFMVDKVEHHVSGELWMSTWDPWASWVSKEPLA